VPCKSFDRLQPYTSSTARDAGWQWRIALQHRIGNGHVYCNSFVSDQQAGDTLMANLPGEALDQPRQLRFTAGRRRKAWIRNCVAIGLSSGFLEPIESTSIQLIESGVGSLIELFPDMGFAPELATEYNRRVETWYDSVRDFIILHYKLTRRDDSEFWRYCANMPIPDRLQHQIDTFRRTGRVVVFDPNGFLENSWLSLYFGLGLFPETYDPFVDLMDVDQIATHFERLRQVIARTAAASPDHAEFIARNCKASPPAQIAPRDLPATK
jgi:tryptophan halogenase